MKFDDKKKQSLKKILKSRYIREYPESKLVVEPGQSFEKAYTLQNVGDY